VLPIQTLDLTVPVTKAAGLKGQVKFAIDEVVVPTVNVGNYTQSPYATSPHPGLIQQSWSAVVARNSGLILQAPPNAVIRVEQINVINENGAASTYAVRWINPVDIALVNQISTLNVNDANAMVQVLTETRLGSAVIRMDHTSMLGTGLDRFEIAAQGTNRFEFRDGFALYGNDPLGRSGIVLWNETQNNTIHATFFVNEYKLPG